MYLSTGTTVHIELISSNKKESPQEETKMETVHKLGVYTKIDTGTVRKKRVIQGTQKNYCDVYIRLKTKRIISIYI